jgi:hypothetical protein
MFESGKALKFVEEEILLNSCGESGRIDIQIMENENSYKAMESQIEA